MAVRGRLVTAARHGVVLLRRRVDLLLPTVSLARVVPGPDTLPGRAIGVFVLASAFFAVAPRVFPDLLDPDADRGLRTLFAVTTVAFSAAFSVVFASGRIPIRGGLLAFAVLLAAIITFDLYLGLVKEWNLLDSKGKAVALVDEIAPHDLQDELGTDFERRGWRRYVAVSMWLGALGMYFAIPSFLAGLFGVLVGTAFPFPDLLLLAVVSFDTATRTEYETDRFDLEGRLYRVVKAAQQSLTAAVLVLVLAAGILFPVQLLVAALRRALEVATTSDWTTSVAVRWNTIGTTAVLVAVAVYDFWVWLRVVERLPKLSDHANSDSARSNAPAYPFGLTVPPTAALVVLAPFDPFSTVAASNHLLAALWPVLFVGLGLSALASLGRSGSVSTVERWLVVGALLVQTTGGVVALHAGQLFEASTDPLLLFVLAVFPLLAYLPDVIQYATEYDDGRRYATGLYLSYLAVVAAIVSLTAPKPTDLGIRFFALGVAIGGLTLILGEFLFP